MVSYKGALMVDIVLAFVCLFYLDQFSTQVRAQVLNTHNHGVGRPSVVQNPRTHLACHRGYHHSDPFDPHNSSAAPSCGFIFCSALHCGWRLHVNIIGVHCHLPVDPVAPFGEISWALGLQVDEIVGCLGCL